jgi:release factor glutamine methyltransferase
LRIRDIFVKEKDVTMLDLVNIIAHALSIRKEEVFAGYEREVCRKEASRIERLLKSRREGTPLAYILKEKEFFSETFFVDERVLVPRPETEALVEEALKIIRTRKDPLLLLDMGTGPGTIGLTIAKKTRHDVICVDISPDALCVAKKNALLLDVSDRTSLICSDLFSAIQKSVKFDLILANLPYIPSEEWNALTCDVRNFEPEIALNGGEGGVEIYRRFIDVLPHYLKRNGHVLCEIGSATQAVNIQKALGYSGLEAEIKLDLSGKERVIIGSWINLS